ncbi:MAG: GNAT family N-acetyltransferase [Alphaproteobacteria bacterium]|nr:GNAT family N-acetyltransferase [Alphaproteobacteria bacterium]
MRLAIRHNMAAFLSPSEISAATETMGVDRALIADRTYFVVFAGERQASGEYTEKGRGGAPSMVGCGGWGKRRTLYGGDASPGRDDRLSDPARDAARIRAMYTHPDWTRRGVGSLLLRLGEDAARTAGFAVIELGSTIPGEPLYRARGYSEFARDRHVGANGAENIVIRMRKAL